MKRREMCLLIYLILVLQWIQYILHAEAIIRGKGVGLLPHYFAEKHLKRHPEVFVSCLPEWKGKSLPVYLQYPFGHLPKKECTH